MCISEHKTMLDFALNIVKLYFHYPFYFILNYNYCQLAFPERISWCLIWTCNTIKQYWVHPSRNEVLQFALYVNIMLKKKKSECSRYSQCKNYWTENNVSKLLPILAHLCGSYCAINDIFENIVGGNEWLDF